METNPCRVWLFVEDNSFCTIIVKQKIEVRHHNSCRSRQFMLSDSNVKMTQRHVRMHKKLKRRLQLSLQVVTQDCFNDSLFIQYTHKGLTEPTKCDPFR